jgi:hypothetical protein
MFAHYHFSKYANFANNIIYSDLWLNEEAKVINLKLSVLTNKTMEQLLANAELFFKNVCLLDV